MTNSGEATINPVQGMLKPVLLFLVPSIVLTIVVSIIASVGFAFAVAAFAHIR